MTSTYYEYLPAAARDVLKLLASGSTIRYAFDKKDRVTYWVSGSGYPAVVGNNAVDWLREGALVERIPSGEGKGTLELTTIGRKAHSDLNG